MDGDDGNVEIVERAFAALAQGDVSLFSPSYTHLGYNIDGRPRIFDGLGSFLEMMGRIADTFEVFEHDTVSSTTVGEELVQTVLNVRRRTPNGKEYEGEIVMTFRVEDGVVTRGTDMIDSAGEAYWSSLGL